MLLNFPIKRVFLALAAAGLLVLPGLAQARVYWSVGVPVYDGAYGLSWYPGWGGGWYDRWDAPFPVDSWSLWSPPVVVERQPVVVQSLPLGPAPQSFWYYCHSPAGYYPYVSTCPGGWMTVPATPPPPPASDKG